MRKPLLLVLVLLLSGASAALAQDVPTEAASPEALEAVAAQTHLNYVWAVLAAVLVFFMQAGFALLETGFTRSKTVCLRVNGHLEHIGLDLHEHDNQAYPEFVETDELSLAEV